MHRYNRNGSVIDIGRSGGIVIVIFLLLAILLVILLMNETELVLWDFVVFAGTRIGIGFRFRWRWGRRSRFRG